MLSPISFLCSPLISYKKNYEIQSSMFKWLDQNTKKTKWVRFPASCVFIASNLTTFITRIMGVVESFFDGLAILLKVPFSEKKIEKAKHGLYQISIETSKNILRVVFVAVEFFVDGTFGLGFEPKYYIISMSEFMKVNLDHARKGTIGSLQHSSDLLEADGIAYTKLLRYQGVTKKNKI